MKLEGSFMVEAPRAVTWERITDPAIMVGCIPGCESIEVVDETTYKTVVAVALGIIKARFNLVVKVTKEEPPNAIYATTTGEEGTRASMVRAENVVRLEEAGESATLVSYASEVSLSGRLGKYGLGMMRKKAAALSDAFAANFQAALEQHDGPATAEVSGEVHRSRGVERLKGWFGISAKDRSSGPPETARETSPAEEAAGLVSPSSRCLVRPKTVTEAVAHLNENERTRPLSGGATLIAMKNAGLVEVDLFVSLEGIEDLRGITRTDDGRISIGAMTRHAETAANELLKGNLEVVRAAAGQIANPVVRNMGTIGGSVANADPAADYLAALVCVDAVICIAGPDGAREVPVQGFISDWYTTELMPAEIITAIQLPAPGIGRSAYRKVARVSGDFATASCAISVSEANGARSVRIALGGCGPSPIRDREAEAELSASNFHSGDIDRFSAKLVALSDPIDDVRGSADYRRALIPRLISDVLNQSDLFEVTA